MTNRTGFRFVPTIRHTFVLTLALLLANGSRTPAGLGETYLSDAFKDLVQKHNQQWGRLGLDTATKPTDGRPAAPIRIGKQTYKKGIGHHAKGELIFNLAGKYTAFKATVGVHPQGGKRGSVVFQVFVDGKKRFDSGVMTDSDPAKGVDVALVGAKELRLVSGDAGNGISCDMANWAEARLVRDPTVPDVGCAEVTLCGKPAPPPSDSVCGFSVIARDDGPQVALTATRKAFIAAVRRNEDVCIAIPIQGAFKQCTVSAQATALTPGKAEVSLSLGENAACKKTLADGTVQLEASAENGSEGLVVRLKTKTDADAAVRWHALRFSAKEHAFDLSVVPTPAEPSNGPPPVLPALRPALEQALIEWDWRMQDGIDTEREPRTYAAAIERTLERGDALVRDLEAAGVTLDGKADQWADLRREWKERCTCKATPQPQWEDLWRRVHALRREIAFANPLAQVGPLLFVKQLPGVSSHQLTQVYGHYARPGGGVFVLDEPLRSMKCRELTGSLPTGSCQNLDLEYDADRALFAFCEADTVPIKRDPKYDNRYYHLYEMTVDGKDIRKLTDGPFDDFAPRYLPNGEIMFVSTRRLGWHRCGNPGCKNYTLALADADGANPRPISYHETQEWDPAVDRHAVYYEQLWSVRPDGTLPSAFYGNNTFNPVGVWEPRHVPGSPRIIATAGAHHAMTAGSIILVDVNAGVDGLNPVTRLTPDALFPESETYLAPKNWYAPAGITEPPVAPPEQKRWPGHCYRSPFALSETYFLAAYSFDTLIGEPSYNPANMWGLYLVDRFGNKELLYRDANIASLWPVPLRPRKRPPVMSPTHDRSAPAEGTYFVQNVYEADPPLPDVKVKRLRIVQVLPKSTPGINRPTVGLANASPGKQVLGTVPVEPDGSAFFRAPAEVALSFQALDEHGQAVQVMRSIAYLQSGENAACVGCHESRTTAPPPQAVAQALMREPSVIEPAPDGSMPLSYPILVQPVLDKHCVACHSKEKPEGKVVLTGNPDGRYTTSYKALAPRVSFSTWGGKKGDFRKVNSEPLARPDFFGARGSSLMKLLLEGHGDVKLTPEDTERLATWMDANALFYGTFDYEDQAKQQEGGRIQGPKLQ